MRYLYTYVLLLSLFFSGHLLAQTPLQCDGKFFVSHSKASGANDSTYVDQINFNGGTTVITPFGNSDTLGINALGFNPIDGFIYGLQYHQYTPYRTKLIKIDATGTFYDLDSVTGDFPVPFLTGSNAFAGCFDTDGTYYVSEDPENGMSGNLYKIDVATNVSTLVGPTGIFPSPGADIFLADMAIDPASGKLYGVTNFCCGENSLNSSAIFEIDKTTGAATWLRQLSPVDSYFGLVFNDDGQLFAYKSNGTLYNIDLQSGTITQVANGQSFTFADAANCSFRLSNYLSATASCAGNAANIVFTGRINNYAAAPQSNVGYELILPDDIFFTDTEADIETALTPLYGGAVNATISSVNAGTNNKLEITNLDVAVNNILSPATTFTLNASINNPTANYAVIAKLTNLPVDLGTVDPSDDPTTFITEDSTQLALAFVCSVLPVNLTDFEVTGHNNYTSLSWKAPKESNSNYFIVEKSIDGQNWNSIGKVTANSAAKSKYDFIDAAPVNGRNYYRLKQFFMDQSFEYSSIRSVKFGADKKLVTVFPNPSRSVFQLQSSVNKSSVYEIADASGRVVKRGKFSSNLKVYELTSGVYIAKINTDNIIETIKIVVQ